MISYQIPTYKLRGNPVLYFAGWKEHYSVYPATVRILNALERELASYDVKAARSDFQSLGRSP
jgi:uncharacterized protein YdhG (YjbR/CyaY superfamily)